MSSDRGEWTSIFQILRRGDPALLSALEVEFPDFKNSIRGVHVYGGDANNSTRRAALANKIADVALKQVLLETRKAFDLVERRSKILRRLKFAGGTLAALAGGGTVGTLRQGAPELGSIIAALVALAGTTLNLYAIYVDEGAGGNGAIGHLRETLATNRRTVVLLEGELRLARLTHDNS
jgi:hypothetical protein